ncbi:hypothetical protein VQY87_004776 [Salmonella enterica]|nr:hypothetical protein [Salmonella enterica]
MRIEATFNYISYPDKDSKTGYSFAINNDRILPRGVDSEPRQRDLGFTEDERTSYREMVAADPYSAIRDAQGELYKRGVIVSSFTLFSNGRKSEI